MKCMICGNGMEFAQTVNGGDKMFICECGFTEVEFKEGPEPSCYFCGSTFECDCGYSAVRHEVCYGEDVR